MSRILLPLSLLACSTPDPDETGDTGDADDGACGDVSTHDVRVRAKVVDASGDAAADIDVVLDDRGWEMVELGGATTDAKGEVDFVAVGVTSVEDCWGTVLNYQLVATDPADTSRTVEDGINSHLYAAIDDGSLVADVRDFPLTLP